MDTTDQIRNCQYNRKLYPVTDRLHDAEHQLRALLQNYHSPSIVRSCFGAFTKAVIEVPAVLQQTLQNDTAFQKWFAPHWATLEAAPLRQRFYEERRKISHQREARLTSTCQIGIHNGSMFRLALPLDGIDLVPTDDLLTDAFVRKDHPLHAFRFGNDGTEHLAAKRSWRLEGIDGDLSEACLTLWKMTADLVALTVEQQGGPLPPLSSETTFPDPEEARLLVHSLA